jgi:hypothetical protein
VLLWLFQDVVLWLIATNQIAHFGVPGAIVGQCNMCHYPAIAPGTPFSPQADLTK